MPVKPGLKTPRMLLLEERFHPQKIDEILLDAITNSHGEFNSASRFVGIGAPTLTQWVQRLGLSVRASEIRVAYGLEPNSAEYQITQDSTGGFHINQRASGPCSNCGHEINQLRGPFGFEGMTHPKDREEMFICVRDSHGDKHWFKMDMHLVGRMD